MTQINYDAARDTSGVGSGAHAVTVGTGVFTLSGLASVSVDNTATKAEILNALRALEQVVSRDMQAHTRPGTISSGDALTDESANPLTDEAGNLLSTNWDAELTQLDGADVTSSDSILFVEDGALALASLTGFVTNLFVAADAIDDGALFAAGAITTAKFTDGSVDTAFIATGAVTEGKIAALAVDSEHIADDAITTIKLAADVADVTTLADTAVTPGAFTTSVTVDAQGRVTAGVA